MYSSSILDEASSNFNGMDDFLKIRNRVPQRSEFRILQRTGTRSNSIIPEFLSPKGSKNFINRVCSNIVFTSVFAAIMLWSLSAMAALPTSLSEKNGAAYSVPAPKVTSVMMHSGIIELVVACFPGEAILSRPKYEKSYYNANMEKHTNLKVAMEVVCKSSGRISLDRYDLTGSLDNLLK